MVEPAGRCRLWRIGRHMGIQTGSGHRSVGWIYSRLPEGPPLEARAEDADSGIGPPFS
jgi:hypothetical protein